MITLPDKQIFGVDGSLLKTEEVQALAGTILLIVQCSGGNPLPTVAINLELRRCGFFQNNEQITLILGQLQKEGLVRLQGNENDKPSNLTPVKDENHEGELQSEEVQEN